MALGRAAYIRLAPELAPGTDAGTSEELGISLAFALPKAPMTVLQAIDLKVGPTLGVSRVCGKPSLKARSTTCRVMCDAPRLPSATLKHRICKPLRLPA